MKTFERELLNALDSESAVDLNAAGSVTVSLSTSLAVSVSNLILNSLDDEMAALASNLKKLPSSPMQKREQACIALALQLKKELEAASPIRPEQRRKAAVSRR